MQFTSGMLVGRSAKCLLKNLNDIKCYSESKNNIMQINKSQQAHRTVKSCWKVYLMNLGGDRLALPIDYQCLS